VARIGAVYYRNSFRSDLRRARSRSGPFRAARRQNRKVWGYHCEVNFRCPFRYLPFWISGVGFQPGCRPGTGFPSALCPEPPSLAEITARRSATANAVLLRLICARGIGAPGSGHQWRNHRVAVEQGLRLLIGSGLEFRGGAGTRLHLHPVAQLDPGLRCGKRGAGQLLEAALCGLSGDQGTAPRFHCQEFLLSELPVGECPRPSVMLARIFDGTRGRHRPCIRGRGQ